MNAGQRRNPLLIHTRLIGMAPDRLGPLLLATAARIAFSQRQGAAHALALQVVVVGVQPVLVAAEPPADP